MSLILRIIEAKIQSSGASEFIFLDGSMIWEMWQIFMVRFCIAGGRLKKFSMLWI